MWYLQTRLITLTKFQTTPHMRKTVVDDVRRAFEHRLNAYRSWESICRYCLRTVAVGSVDIYMELVEDNHICNEMIAAALNERCEIHQFETKH